MCRTPREIETKFRKSLGVINPLMCVADIATRELIKKQNEEIIKLSKEYNHKRLNLRGLELEKVALYVNLAHIAYINSRADSFCNDVLKFSKKNRNFQKSYQIDPPLDNLRKAVFLVYAGKNNSITETTKKLEEEIYIEHIGQEELIIIDYYRKIRNLESHGGANVNISKISPIDVSDEKNIFDKYNFCPNQVPQITIRDVILYSQAWQSAAVKFCRKLVNIDNFLLGKFLRKYKNADEMRRNNAMRQKMKQDYLLSEPEINILESNGWVA